MKLNNVNAIYLAVLLGLCGHLASQEQGIFTYDQLFPDKIAESIGLKRLSVPERELLRNHIEALIARAIILGSQNSDILKMEPARQNGADRGKPKLAVKGALYAGGSDGHWIKDNIDSGNLLLLEDGSLWKIDPIETANAMLWLPISDVMIIESTDGSPGYDYLIICIDDSEKAHAKYMGNN